MKKYVFYDTDLTGQAQYDISGNEYLELIKTCCKYSTTFSLKITNTSHSIFKELARYKIPVTQSVLNAYQHYSDKSDIHHYRLYNEIQETLLNTCGSIFQWINGWGYTNPDDPAFYRDDGSVFFESTIHEGICILYPLENEDISTIIENKLWIEYQE
ncbi:MAG: hypothetical protein E7456_07490 [Ruminococcaceae bacterium]|nr:hypothetical protein [Oscillospiraceae bacterium]